MHAVHAVSHLYSQARTQFETTTQTRHAVGHGIISVSTLAMKKKKVIKNLVQNDMQIEQNSRNLCHLSPIILLITSHCGGLLPSAEALIIQCICPHFPKPNQ